MRKTPLITLLLFAVAAAGMPAPDTPTEASAPPPPPPPTTSRLKQIFGRWDVENNNKISADELRLGLKTKHAIDCEEKIESLQRATSLNANTTTTTTNTAASDTTSTSASSSEGERSGDAAAGAFMRAANGAQEDPYKNWSLSFQQFQRFAEGREKKLRAAFDALDVNGDGRIGVPELRTGMESLGVATHGVTDEQLRELIRHIAADGAHDADHITYEECVFTSCSLRCCPTYFSRVQPSALTARVVLSPLSNACAPSFFHAVLLFQVPRILRAAAVHRAARHRRHVVPDHGARRRAGRHLAVAGAQRRRAQVRSLHRAVVRLHLRTRHLLPTHFSLSLSFTHSSSPFFHAAAATTAR
jgi:Ca2+-binding EF-hand superfamily protein